MIAELLKEALITRVSNASASGTTTVTSSVLDMQGYDAVAFIALMDSVSDGSVLNLSVKENSANSTSSPTPTAISGATTGDITASSDSNHVLAAEAVRPSKRYVFCTLTRGTAASTVDGILAIQYRAKSVPVTQANLIGSATGGPED